MPVDELLAAVDARQEAEHIPPAVTYPRRERDAACPPPRNPSDPPAPRTPSRMGQRSRARATTPPPPPAPPSPGPCGSFVSGGTVWCCEEGETDCPCVCHGDQGVTLT